MTPDETAGTKGVGMAPDDIVSLRSYLEHLLQESAERTALALTAAERSHDLNFHRIDQQIMAVAVELRNHIDNQVGQIRMLLDAQGELARQATDYQRLSEERAREVALKGEAMQKERDTKNNEFRQQLRDQATTFMSRDAIITALDAVQNRFDSRGVDRDRRLSTLETFMYRNEGGRATMVALMGAILAITAIAVSIFLHYAR